MCSHLYTLTSNSGELLIFCSLPLLLCQTTVVSHCHSLSFCLFNVIGITFFPYPTRTSGRWDGVVVICCALRPADRRSLICNALWPSVPAIEHAWFVTRSVSLSVSPPLCVWFVACSGTPAPHWGWEGSDINMWLDILRELTLSFFFLSSRTDVKRIKLPSACLSTFLIYAICILWSNSWHLDDKLTLLGVALQSMN